VAVVPALRRFAGWAWRARLGGPCSLRPGRLRLIVNPQPRAAHRRRGLPDLYPPPERASIRPRAHGPPPGCRADLEEVRIRPLRPFAAGNGEAARRRLDGVPGHDFASAVLRGPFGREEGRAGRPRSSYRV
jgi:hypothetical protein